ncbi:MAG: radical SAM/Cys-rich domain protein [Acidobacteria bacterium]|nr:MAG: radical SAM/Cys-rich domain protein [Acidobacteriota bacterium]
MEELPILNRNAFERRLQEAGLPSLTRSAVKTLQVNVGKLCNQTCSHCHVEAGPNRPERMLPETAAAILHLLKFSPSVEVLDITGGAPELNENFLDFVAEARSLGKRVINRSNLTAFLLPKHDGLPGFLASNQVEIVASLPCYTRENVDRQRGAGVFEKSIQALRVLNDTGYGMPGSGLTLNLAYNPLGAFLPGPQAQLEQDYREHLRSDFRIEFNHLLTMVNMPLGRFAETLHRGGEYDEYLSQLVNSFNKDTVAGLMCRSLISVGWNGYLYDCDFNQMLEMNLVGKNERLRVNSHVNSLESLSELEGLPVLTDDHCFGCTAGCGSSCRGALA